MLCGSHSSCSSLVSVLLELCCQAQHCCSLSPALLALSHRDLEPGLHPWFHGWGESCL